MVLRDHTPRNCIDLCVRHCTLSLDALCQPGCSNENHFMSSRCSITRPHSLSPSLVTWPMVMVIILATRTLPGAAQVVTVAALSEVRGLTSGDACKALPTPGLRSALSRQRG